MLNTAKPLRIVSIFVALLMSILVSNSQAQTHRKPLRGKVVAVEGDTVTVLPDPEPRPESVKVTIVTETKLTKGSELSSKDALSEGSHVTVHGTKLASGELVAIQVQVD